MKKEKTQREKMNEIVEFVNNHTDFLWKTNNFVGLNGDEWDFLYYKYYKKNYGGYNNEDFLEIENFEINDEEYSNELQNLLLNLGIR